MLLRANWLAICRSLALTLRYWDLRNYVKRWRKS